LSLRLPKIIFVALAVYAAAYFSSYYGRLPQILASHFDARGHPNGWETKPVFFAVFAGALVLAAIVGLGAPLLIKTLPAQLINLPNKEEWLSPAFRETTLDYMSSWFAWFGCGLLLLLMLTFRYAVQANLDPAHRADATRFWYYIGGFGIFVAIWMGRFLAKFSRPPGRIT
jgi:Protein of unknown function (DUF1648)